MSAPAVDLLALLDSDPANGILAAADLRETRAKEESENCPPPWAYAGGYIWDANGEAVAEPYFETGEHIAAEANPSHVLAAVRRWRGVVERHEGQERAQWAYGGLGGMRGAGRVTLCTWCPGPAGWPCPDLTETADEARAYLGGAA